MTRRSDQFLKTIGMAALKAKYAKHFPKFARDVPPDAGDQILASFSTGPLAGLYGLMFTDCNLRSRDFLQELVFDPREPRLIAQRSRVSHEGKHKIIVVLEKYTMCLPT